MDPRAEAPPPSPEGPPRNPLSRRERKKRDTRRRLYAAAMALFKERGFDGTRVEDITEQADVAVGTFFNYFPTKESVLLGDREASLQEAVEHARSLDEGTARERIEAHLRWRARRATRADRRIVRLFHRYVLADPDAVVAHQPLVDALVGVYAEWIEEGRRAGEVRVDVDPGTAARMVDELWVQAALRYAADPDGPELEDALLARVDLLFRGMQSA